MSRTTLHPMITPQNSSVKFENSALSIQRSSMAFTLIELLVVITIIAILAGLSFAGVQGALKSAKKAEVRAMANQIKLGIEAYYAEYGYYPTVTESGPDFLKTMTGTNTNNLRGIRFLELPKKFTNGDGIVTPLNFYSAGQKKFEIRVDTDYDGVVTAPNNTNYNQSVVVGVRGTAPDDPNWIATWQ